MYSMPFVCRYNTQGGPTQRPAWIPPMRGNHSPRPVRSFRSPFSLRSSSPSHQPRSSPANNDTDTPSTSQHEPHRPMSTRPQAQINGLPLAQATPPLPSSRVFVRKPTFAAVPLSKSSDHLSSPSPPRRRLQGRTTATRTSLKVRSFETSVTNDAPSNLCWNQPSTTRRSRLSRKSTPRYQEARHSTLHQPTKVYGPQSVNQQSSVDPPPHQSRHGHRPTLRHPQVEQVPQPGTLLELPSSNQDPSRSWIRGSDMFYQAHDFVIKDPVFIDNNSDNCE
jgi:hypothetical protein